MTKYLFCIIAVSVAIISCSKKYQAYTTHYNFKSETGIPDYQNLDYWAAHPWKWDASDSIPEPLREEVRDTLADVFFLYPTTFTSKKDADQSNAFIDDKKINAKTDYSTILYQASVFNQHCRVFAPRYRQAHISNFRSKNKSKATAAFELAYLDLKNAFEYYIKNWNNGRPIIIAGHSQGAFLAERLLKEYFEQKELKKQLVAAYVIGWPVPKEYFTKLKMCEDSLQTGCLISWRTYRTGHVPSYIKNGNTSSDNLFRQGNSYVTNPLSWKTDEENISKEWNKGSVLTKFNKIYKHTTNAKIENDLLYVNRPKFPGSFLYFSKSYHIADINLFYINIRENVEQRIKSFLQ
ncbi:MAG: DUF3089 domain-containing protein [Chitinophagaceae bacterium]